MPHPHPVRVFVSYAHEDRHWCDKLLRHLGALRKSGRLHTFSDSQIVPGEWETQLKAELEQADIIVLIISASFGNSRFCTSVELKGALDRFDRDSIHVVPILAEHCDWQALPIARFQMFPQNAQGDLAPLRDWPDANRPLSQIAQTVRRLVEQPGPNSGEQPTTPEDTPDPSEIAGSGSSVSNQEIFPTLRLSGISWQVVWILISTALATIAASLGSAWEEDVSFLQDSGFGIAVFGAAIGLGTALILTRGLKLLRLTPFVYWAMTGSMAAWWLTLMVVDSSYFGFEFLMQYHYYNPDWMFGLAGLFAGGSVAYLLLRSHVLSITTAAAVAVAQGLAWWLYPFIVFAVKDFDAAQEVGEDETYAAIFCTALLAHTLIWGITRRNARN